MSEPTGPRRGRLARWWWLAGLAIAVAIVVVLAPLASPDPDGLESVGQSQGWIEQALDPIFSIVPDYTVPGLDGPASTVVAGLIGVGLVFLAMVGLGRLLRRRRPNA